MERSDKLVYGVLISLLVLILTSPLRAKVDPFPSKKLEDMEKVKERK
jgi:hypothetical protein